MRLNLAFKKERSNIVFQKGRAHYWLSKGVSSFKMHLFTLSPVLTKKGGCLTIAFYFTFFG
jgi:hypothetical protein